MPKVFPEKHKTLNKGVPLIIDIEVRGRIYKVKIPCPECKYNGWLLREDHTGIYCAKCRFQIGYIASDIADMEKVGWAI